MDMDDQPLLRASKAIMNLKQGHKDACLQEDMIKRLNKLKSIREPWLARWKECADFVMPYKGSNIYATTNTDKSGSTQTPNIYDNTATMSARILSAGILSGLTSPTKPWFELSAGVELDDNPEVKQWLAKTAEILRAILNGTNFYDACQLVYEDLTIFGIGSLLMYEDSEDVIRFYHCPVGEYMIGLDARREPTIFYEELSLSAYEIVDKFGLDNVSQNVLSLYNDKGQMETQVAVTHVIQKNKDFDPDEKNSDEYIDCYFETTVRDGTFLRKTGFKEKPFCSVRWNTIGRDPYGISPTLDCLGDIKQLQHVHKRKGQGIDRTFASPLLADLSLRDEGVSLLPNAITFMRNSKNIGVEPIFKFNTNFSPIIEDIQDIRNRVQKSYYRDLFMMLDSLEGVQPRNQLELMKREGEKLLQLEPMTHRLQKEFLNIIITRALSIAGRKKMLPPLPPSLKGGEAMKVEYISQLATSLKAAGTASIEQFVAFVGNLSAGQPSAIDKINTDNIIDQYGKMLNLNPEMIVPTKEANKSRQSRMEQAQQQQMMEQGLMAAQGAKTLSETNVGGGQNALNLVTGL
jgi:hypothetical protein